MSQLSPLIGANGVAGFQKLIVKEVVLGRGNPPMPISLEIAQRERCPFFGFPVFRRWVNP